MTQTGGEGATQTIKECDAGAREEGRLKDNARLSRTDTPHADRLYVCVCLCVFATDFFHENTVRPIPLNLKHSSAPACCELVSWVVQQS